jgi:hypothetical protein
LTLCALQLNKHAPFFFLLTRKSYLPSRSLKALSTNMLYYSGYKYASEMGRELGIVDESIREMEDKARLLRATIQRR